MKHVETVPRTSVADLDLEHLFFSSGAVAKGLSLRKLIAECPDVCCRGCNVVLLLLIKLIKYF